MKNMFKNAVIILLVLAVAGSALFKILARRPVISDNYGDKIETGGEIEKKYLAMGSYEVSYLEQAGLHDFKKSFETVLCIRRNLPW